MKEQESSGRLFKYIFSSWYLIHRLLFYVICVQIYNFFLKRQCIFRKNNEYNRRNVKNRANHTYHHNKSYVSFETTMLMNRKANAHYQT